MTPQEPVTPRRRHVAEWDFRAEGWIDIANKSYPADAAQPVEEEWGG